MKPSFIRIDIEHTAFYCDVPPGVDDITAEKYIGRQAKKYAEAIEEEIFDRFVNEYRRLKAVE